MQKIKRIEISISFKIFYKTMSKQRKHHPKEDMEEFYLPADHIPNLYGPKMEITEILKSSFYSLMRYSRSVQDKYMENDIINSISKELETLRNLYDIKIENITKFFKMLQNERIDFCSDDYCDFSRLCDFFKVESVEKLLRGYIDRHSENIDMILNLMVDQITTQNTDLIDKSQIVGNIEEMLSNNIEKCIEKETFGKLPISTIYKIIEKSDRQHITSDMMHEFITKKFDERFPLLHFVCLRNLTDEKFNELYQVFESVKETASKSYFDYLPNEIEYIKTLRDDNRKLQREKQQYKNQIAQLQTKLNESNKKNQEYEAKIQQMNKENNQLGIQLQDLTMKYKQSQLRIQNLENKEEEYLKQVKELKKEIKQQQSQNAELNSTIAKLKMNNISEKELLNYFELIAKYVPKALHLGCKSGNVQLVKYLISHQGIDVNESDIFK